MSNLNFIIKLTDLLTPAMRSAAGVSEGAANKIKSQFTGIEYSGKKMTASVSELRSALEQMNTVRFGTHIKKEFDDATKGALLLERQITKIEGRKTSGMGGMLGGVLAGVGIGSIIKGALGQAVTAENQKVAFGVLTGSQKEGDSLYANINKMADATPFESQDLGRSAKTMLNYGVDKKQIMPALSMMGDITAAAENPAESLQSLALAFGQVTAKGHLAGQETLQMVNAGFNPLKEIADITGISIDKLQKAEEKGAITTAMVSAAFQHATGPGGKFHDMMIKQSQTLGGKWSTFMDGVHHKLRDLGDLLKPAAKWIVDFGTALLSNMPLLIGIGAAIVLVTADMYLLTAATAVWNFVAGMNPIVRIISLILILGGFIYSLCKQYEGWGQSIQAVWEIIKAFGLMAWIPFKAFGETSWYYVQKLWLNIEDFAQSITQTFSKVGQAWDLAKGGDFAGAKAALTANVQTQASRDIADLEAKHNANQNSYALEYANAQKSIYDNSAKIGLRKITGGVQTINATTANGAIDKKAFGGLNDFAGDKGGKSKADGINGGGQRSIVINIAKQIETLAVHVLDAKGGANEIESMVREAMRRVMYSMNGVATS